MKESFRVGEWTVNPQVNTFTANDRTERVEPRVMEVLVYLADNAGEVISRESLLDALWPDMFVTPEVVTTSIFELRKALGDDARQPRFIQTISKRGYRLIAPVSFEQGQSGEAAEPATNGTAGALSPGGERQPGAIGQHIRKSAVVAAAVTILVVITGAILIRQPNPDNTRRSSGDSIEPAAAAQQAAAAYAKGREFRNRRTREALNAAVEHFERAVTADPAYGLAHAALADSYSLLVEHNYLRPEDGYPKARAAALRALEIDKNLPEALAARGLIRFLHDWDWAGAELDYRRAIETDPNCAVAHGGYSRLLLASGRLDEARAAMERSVELDPDSLGLRLNAGGVYFRLQEYERAALQFQAALAINEDNPATLKALGHAYEKLARLEEAKAAYRKSFELTGLPPPTRFSTLFSRWSRKGDHRFLMDKLSVLLKQEYVRPSYIAGLYVYFGEHEVALDWLEKAFREKDSNVLFLKTDETWNSLRRDPRFVGLQERSVPSL